MSDKLMADNLFINGSRVFARNERITYPLRIIPAQAGTEDQRDELSEANLKPEGQCVTETLL